MHNEKGSAVTLYPSSYNVLLSRRLPHGLSHAWFLLAAGVGRCQRSFFLLGKAARLCPCLSVILSQAVLSPLVMGEWEKEVIATVCLDLVSSYQTHHVFMLPENLLKSLKKIVIRLILREWVYFVLIVLKCILSSPLLSCGSCPAPLLAFEEPFLSAAHSCLQRALK